MLERLGKLRPLHHSLGRLGLTLQMTAGMTTHLLDKLQESRSGLGRRVLPLENLHHTDTLLLTLQRAQDDQIVGR